MRFLKTSTGHKLPYGRFVIESSTAGILQPTTLNSLAQKDLHVACQMPSLPLGNFQAVAIQSVVMAYTAAFVTAMTF